MSEKKDNCAGCLFAPEWVKGMESLFCQRYPPSVSATSSEVQFPIVRSDWWCGEFKARPVPPVPEKSVDELVAELNKERADLFNFVNRSGGATMIHFDDAKFRRCQSMHKVAGEVIGRRNPSELKDGIRAMREFTRRLKEEQR